MIKALRGQLQNRLSFVDLGCGLGQFSTMAVFAGARVDAVDFKDTLVEANKLIYRNTKKIIGYDTKNSKDYYRAFPESLVCEKPAWTQTPHQVAHCSNVLHFFTENEIQLFATRVYQNLTSGGVLFVQTDTPLISQDCLNFYKKRLGDTLCPGLAIYNKKSQTNGLELVGTPIPYDENIHTIRLGKKYRGKFLKDGKIFETSECYHNIRNLFLVEELVTIFSKAEFKATKAFYLNNIGSIIAENGQLPEIGKPSKACVMFMKP